MGKEEGRWILITLLQAGKVGGDGLLIEVAVIRVLKARGNWGGGHLNKNFIFLLLLKVLHSESSILENTE